MNTRGKTGQEGFSLVELMFTAGVMTVGLVMLMSSVISVSTQSRVTDATVAAAHFNNSVLETMRGREIEDILQFNKDDADLNTTNGKLFIDGLGVAEVKVWCVFPETDAIDRIAIPMSDSRRDEVLTDLNLTNPVEIQVQLSMDKGFGSGKEFKFMTSSRLYY